MGDQCGLYNVLQYSVDVQSEAKNPLEKINYLDIRFPYKMSIKKQH